MGLASPRVRSLVAVALLASGCVYSTAVEAELARVRGSEDAGDAGLGPADVGFVDAGVPGFSFVPAGSFVMGSPPTEFGRDEGGNGGRPSELQHRVTLSRSFVMKTTEVTQGEWAALLEDRPMQLLDDPDLPLANMTWWEAIAWLDARSRADGLMPCHRLEGCIGRPGTGMDCASVVVLAYRRNPYDCSGYRLPTEAEWEYAARAGTTTAFYSGDITPHTARDPALDPIAWYGGVALSPVALKQPNPWGLYDMAGNASEKVWDWVGDYEAGDAVDPLGQCGDGGCTGKDRGIRGGSASEHNVAQRHAERLGFGPESAFALFGFRAARTANAPEYRLGEPGPAGGLVFYDKGFRSDGWRYLEAAPMDLAPERWGCSGSRFGVRDPEAGTGEAHSRAIADGCRASAAQRVDGFDFGDHYDWFLPSEIALLALYHGLHVDRRGGFTDAPYWSSRETSGDSAVSVDFRDGRRGETAKTVALRLRPIRRF